MLALCLLCLSSAAAFLAPSPPGRALRAPRPAAAVDDGLPIHDVLAECLAALDSSSGVVIEAPPGAGKTTVVPRALLQHAPAWLGAEGRIVVLQPRRVAARGAAARMAFALGEAVGETVGYAVRRDRKSSARTRIECVTDGVLLRRLQRDPSLAGVAAVFIDEAHERGVDADACLALCREAQLALRPDLRLVVMSATAGGGLADAYAALLGGVPVVASDGRCFPVKVVHADGGKPLGALLLARSRDVADVAMAGIDRALAETSGDVLVFLPGVAEIYATQRQLAGRARLRVLPLHAKLSPEAIDLALAAAPAAGDADDTRRRVVLATPIAEASVTIPGVRAVVDCGLRRTPTFSADTGMAVLKTRRISQAAATQRAGRAGRVAPGTCYRMWTGTEHQSLAAQAPAEIEDADLTGLALDLAVWGAGGAEAIAALPWLTTPPPAALDGALATLAELGAVAGGGAVTARGTAMARMALHPRLSHMLTGAEGAGASAATAAALAALLDEAGDVLEGGARTHGADLRPRLEAVLGRGGGASAVPKVVDRVRLALRELLPRGTAAGEANVADAGALLCLAFPERVGRCVPGRNGALVLASGKSASLDRLDALCASEFVVVAATRGGDKATLAAPVAPETLRAVLAGRIRTGDESFIVPSTGEVRARRVERLGKLVLSEVPLKAPPPAELAAMIVAAVAEAGIEQGLLRHADETQRTAFAELDARLAYLRAKDPDGGWPDASLSAAGSEASLSAWLAPYVVDGVTSVKRLARTTDLVAAFTAHALDPAQRRALAGRAPTFVEAPSGRKVPLRYADNAAAPVMSVKLQEMFGCTETPTAAGTPVVIELLSPRGTPLAVTQDLVSFWRDSWGAVRKEMRHKYKKHPWPEDPLTAAPTRDTNAALRRKDGGGGETGGGGGGGGGGAAAAPPRGKKKQRGKSKGK